MTASGWIGVDLDGTLAKYEGWNNGQIGEPVQAMVERVKQWIASGVEVRIFTARVGFGAGYSADSGRSDDDQFAEEQRRLINVWCLKHIGQPLKVTAVKDFAMIELCRSFQTPVYVWTENYEPHPKLLHPRRDAPVVRRLALLCHRLFVPVQQRGTL